MSRRASACQRRRPTSKTPYLVKLSQMGGRTSERWRQVPCLAACYLPVITCSAKSSPGVVPTRGPELGAAIQGRDKPQKHILEKNITYTEGKTASENAGGGAFTWCYKKENVRNVIRWIKAKFPLHKVTLSSGSRLTSKEKKHWVDFPLNHRHEIQYMLLIFHDNHHSELT